MERLSLTAVLGGLSAGLVLCVALAPISNWSFKNDVMMVRSGAVGPRGEQGPWIGPAPWSTLGPTRLFDPHELSLLPAEHQFARALGFAEWGSRFAHPAWNGEIPERLMELEHYCRQHPKAAMAHAQFLRLLFQPAAPIQPPKQKRGSAIQRVNRQRGLLASRVALGIAEKGERLEPDNAFWTTSVGVLAWSLGEKGKSLAALERAADMKRFDDHMLEMLHLIVRTVEERWGYRGEALRLALASGIVLPQYAHNRTWFMVLSKLPEAERGTHVRWAVFRLSYLMARESSSIIGNWVARSGMQFSALGTMQDRVPTKQEKLEWESGEAVSRFEAELAAAGVRTGGQDLRAMAEDVDRLVSAGHKVVQKSGSSFSNDFFVGGAVSALGLLTLLSVLPACLLFLLWVSLAPAGYDRARIFIGFVLFLASILNTRVMSLGSSGSPLGVGTAAWVLLMAALYAVLAAMQSAGVSEKAIRAGFWVCGVAGLFSFLAIDPFGEAAALALANTAGLYLALRFRGSQAVAVSLLAFAALVIGACLVPPIGIEPPRHATFILLMSGAVLCAFSAKHVKLGVSVVVLTGSLIYVGATAYGLMVNSELKKMNVSLITEAEQAREAARLPLLTPRKY